LKVGLVGCGGRGTGAAVQAMNADPHVQLTAIGDLFPDQMEQSLELLRREVPSKVKVDPAHRFVGFDACQKVIDSGVDVVLLCTPPGFRPQHLKAAVEAGKHAFVEITIAVDSPGVRSCLESAEQARRNNLAIVSGFCWRYHYALRAVREQIAAGAIGEVRAIYATYYRGSLGHKHHGPRNPNWTDLEWQIRDWYGYTWLSGDVILLLSGGHSVDKMSWWLGDEMPVKAVGLGGRNLPSDGNIFDHGFVVYEYASGIRGFLGCSGQDGCHTENADYIIGTKGICTIGHGRAPKITGQTAWRYTGPNNNMYQTEHDELFASIRAGKPIQDGTRMAHTTLMAIMGRMATYTGQEITWEQALQSQETLVPDKLDWNTKIALPPLATPGITKLS
jgi:predicted dehydrogenase